MTTTFKEFVDKKTREAKKQLHTIEKVLKKEGMNVTNFLEEDEPHIFLRNPQGGTSFDGVRIYKIGGNIAYRVQKEDRTHPYGKAYLLDVEGMFEDLISDQTEQTAGEQVIKSIAQELRKFFEKNAEAEKEIRQSEFDQKADPMGRITINTQGSDYANSVNSNYHSRVSG